MPTLVTILYSGDLLHGLCCICFPNFSSIKVVKTYRSDANRL